VIRRARPTDIPAIIECGSRLMATSEFRHAGTIDFKSAVDRLTRAMMSRTEFVAVALHRNQLVGFLVFVAQPCWWQPKVWQVSDDIIYCERPGMGRALLKAGIDWARTIPRAHELIVSLNSGLATDRAARVLCKHGLRERGVTLSVELRQKERAWAA
jgi:hypothetical protein